MERAQVADCRVSRLLSGSEIAHNLHVMTSLKSTRRTVHRVRCIALLGLIGYLGCAAAQNASPKQTEAQKRVQTKLFQQKKLECAKLGKYAAATTIRGATLYKCVVRPSG